MSNSVNELRVRHNHCHVNGLLELAVHDHRDVTVEGHEEARQGHELVPERLQVHKATTMHPGGSKSLRPRDKLPRDLAGTLGLGLAANLGLFLTLGKVRKIPSPRSSRDTADELEPPGSGRSCKPPEGTGMSTICSTDLLLNSVHGVNLEDLPVLHHLHDPELECSTSARQHAAT